MSARGDRGYPSVSDECDRGSVMGSRSRVRSGWRAVAGVAAVLCVGIVPMVVAAAPPAAATTPSWHAAGSVDEAWLTGATPGARVVLHRDGAKVAVAGNPG